MSNNYVTLTGNLGPDSAGATLILTPSNWLTDSDNALILPPSPKQVTLNGQGEFSISLLATDNGSPLPTGWTWNAEFLLDGVAPHSFSFSLAHADGATQDVSSLTPIETPPVLGLLHSGSGVPSSELGSDGDYYFRSDGSTNTHIYFKSSGSWSAFA